MYLINLNDSKGKYINSDKKDGIDPCFKSFLKSLLFISSGQEFIKQITYFMYGILSNC